MAVASWSGPPRSARAAQHASHAGFALRSCGGSCLHLLLVEVGSHQHLLLRRHLLLHLRGIVLTGQGT